MSQSSADQNQIQFHIHKLYIKDVSLEVPSAPKIYTQTPRLEVNLQLKHNHTALEDDRFEVVLKLTITAKHGDQNAYLVEVEQAGLFQLKGMSDAQREQMLAAYCPGLLYPYAREAIDNLVIKGGFAPLNLKPIDFGALYLQQKSRQAGGVSASQAVN